MKYQPYFPFNQEIYSRSVDLHYKGTFSTFLPIKLDSEFFC